MESLKESYLALQERLKSLQECREAVCEMLASEDDADKIRVLLKRKKEISSEIELVIKETEEYLEFAAGTGG